jgi:hypothetical protein
MKKITLTLLIIFGFTTHITHAQIRISAVKLKRADSFFGVHFDLHASEDIIYTGKTLTAEITDTFLLKVRPDFIQIY